MKRLASALALSIVVSACGGGSGPTAPQGPQYPSVAGAYSGAVSIAFPELGQSLVCPATSNVAQTGASVSIAPLILSGQCAGMSIPLGNVTIDTNGSLSTISNYTFYEPSCGGNYTASGSGGFFGKQLQLSMSAVSSVCWNINMTVNLSRP